jgi:hypothetical protein
MALETMNCETPIGKSEAVVVALLAFAEAGA